MVLLLAVSGLRTAQGRAAMEFAPDNSALFFLLGQPGGNGSINALPIGGAIASVDLRSGSLRSV
jgi:hypothetical protein